MGSFFDGDRLYAARWRIIVHAVAIIVLLMTGICFIASAHAAGAGSSIVASARAELGRGEYGGDNRGADVRRYLRGREGLPWCAGFVSYVLEHAGANIRYTLGARDFLKQGRRVEDPRPGDLLVFWRGKRNGLQGHGGVIEKVTDKEITVIEGNRGRYPARVERYTYQRGGIPRFLAFVRVR